MGKSKPVKGAKEFFDLNNRAPKQAPLFKDQSPPDIKKMRQEVKELHQKSQKASSKGRTIYE